MTKRLRCLTWGMLTASMSALGSVMRQPTSLIPPKSLNTPKGFNGSHCRMTVTVCCPAYEIRDGLDGRAAVPPVCPIVMS